MGLRKRWLVLVSALGLCVGACAQTGVPPATDASGSMVPPSDASGAELPARDGAPARDGVADSASGRRDTADAARPLPASGALAEWADRTFGTATKQSAGSLLADSFAPFSFGLGTAASRDVIAGWKRTAVKAAAARHTNYTTTWTDAGTGLKVTAVAVLGHETPYVDWVLSFENTGSKDLPILDQIQAIDLGFAFASADQVDLVGISGDHANGTSFAPMKQSLSQGTTRSFAPEGGRSSHGTFPFFDLASASQGVTVAIGWTGQWAATVERKQDGSVLLRAGMEKTHLVLHAGEKIRTPRILLVPWTGSPEDAQHRFKQMLLRDYVPKQANGQPVSLVVGAQGFNRYTGNITPPGGNGVVPRWNTEAGQLEAIRFVSDVGGDAHWLDAAWFKGGFPDGVGNWFPDPAKYPNGLKPLGDESHKKGLKFVLWWEPERVGTGAQIGMQHQNFLLGGVGRGLYNLGMPEARVFMTELLSKQISEYGVDIYRNDFNMAPLEYWRVDEASDRQGITEIRYFEGLYKMWDELRTRHPGLVIDNCASGGNRIDLEMISRTVIATQSDSIGVPLQSEWDQAQHCGLERYVPLHATIGWSPAPYHVRSSATSGYLGEWDYLDPAFPKDQAKASFAEVHANQKYWSGNYYALTPCDAAMNRWFAFQLHRADLDEGMVLVFRRPQAPEATFSVSLRALASDRVYTVDTIDDDFKVTTRTVTGSVLRNLTTSLAKSRSSSLVRYRPAAP